MVLVFVQLLKPCQYLSGQQKCQMQKADFFHFLQMIFTVLLVFLYLFGHIFNLTYFSDVIISSVI